jgi:citrate lyase subunit beta/citryl-CoA lyase
MMRDASLDLTTMLFVPAHRARMIEKARALSASAVILDLEDGVGVGEKSAARAALEANLATDWPERPLRFVRVNGPSSDEFGEDLAAVAPFAPVGICVPKCETAGDVQLVDDALRMAGASREIALLPFVESAAGILNAYEIASASERVVAIALGSEDLAADMGIRRTKRGRELHYFRSHVSTAARAANVLAIDGVFVDFNDPEGLERDASVGRGLGFAGKQIIHPSQVEPVARAYAPSPDEIARATRIVEAFDAAEREGRGVVVVDGRMIDRPLVLQARRLLARR